MAEDTAGDSRPETQVAKAVLRQLEGAQQDRERERRAEMRRAERADAAEVAGTVARHALAEIAWSDDSDTAVGEHAPTLNLLLAGALPVPGGLGRMPIGRATERNVGRWIDICNLVQSLSSRFVTPSGGDPAPRIVVRGTDPETGEKILLFADFLVHAVGLSIS